MVSSGFCRTLVPRSSSSTAKRFCAPSRARTRFCASTRFFACSPMSSLRLSITLSVSADFIFSSSARSSEDLTSRELSSASDSRLHNESLRSDISFLLSCSASSPLLILTTSTSLLTSRSCLRISCTSSWWALCSISSTIRAFSFHSATVSCWRDEISLIMPFTLSPPISRIRFSRMSIRLSDSSFNIINSFCKPSDVDVLSSF
mmetsp:Transcript_24707/g.81036  ORF Transcript_24707/g.81036 Transcript_24707/m.81036 type:complete len:204 (-) Transcript_24707:358-969(-)